MVRLWWWRVSWSHLVFIAQGGCLAPILPRMQRPTVTGNDRGNDAYRQPRKFSAGFDCGENALILLSESRRSRSPFSSDIRNGKFADGARALLGEPSRSESRYRALFCHRRVMDRRAHR